MSPRRLRIIGVGPGDPDQVTLEAVAAMRSVAFFVVTDKSASTRGGAADPLVQAREALLERHLEAPARVVRVDDPPRERRSAFVGTDADYRAAVRDWHAARVDAYLAALAEHPGDAGFLAWGDPAFYDSSIRILHDVAARLDAAGTPAEVDVIPGISSLQVLAARHRMVLHEIGRPLFVTTGRALAAAVAAGHDNVVVMLNATIDLSCLPPEEEWRIWWGGNLGTPAEELVAGPVGAEVTAAIASARDRLRASAGWVMDIYLLRRVGGAAR